MILLVLFGIMFLPIAIVVAAMLLPWPSQLRDLDHEGIIRDCQRVLEEYQPGDHVTNLTAFPNLQRLRPREIWVSDFRQEHPTVLIRLGREIGLSCRLCSQENAWILSVVGDTEGRRLHVMIPDSAGHDNKSGE